jgi:eukaryotic-like serine/threonine-protein kinase
MSDSDEAILAERLDKLSRFEAALAPADTISARTLLAVQDEVEDARRPIVDTNVDLDELPKISVIPIARLGGPGPSPPAVDYELVTTLGEGGMGRVHLARQRSLAREVAIKSLKNNAPPGVARALLREARLTGSLEHPGVIPVHALGIDGAGDPMLVMKRVIGIDFGTLLQNPSHTGWGARGNADDPLSASLEVLAQVCLTLEFSHSRGIIHRDIKPENVMVGGFGEVYLLDWGIATMRDAESEPPDDSCPIVGTPAYMAPEMVIGAEVDERTDVYLLGATLHEILTGAPRHVGATVREVLRAALASEPFVYGPHVPQPLAALCNRATSRERKERPESVQVFREEIVHFQRRRSTQGLCDAALERLRALEGMLADAPTVSASDGRPRERAAPPDLLLAYRLATEARFGLAQSQQNGAGEIAAEGMRRCLIALVELELRQGHADSAEALLREMESPPSELGDRVRVIRERHAARERERKRLERIAQEFDPTALGPKRTRWITGSAVAVAIVWLTLAVRARPPTPGSLVILSVAGNTVVWTALVLLRKIRGNRFNARMGGLLALAFFGSFANRTVAWFVDSTTPVQTLTIDLVVFTVASAAAAIALFRRMWLVSLVFACGLTAIRILPEHGPKIFAFSAIGSLVVGAIVLARASRPS